MSNDNDLAGWEEFMGVRTASAPSTPCGRPPAPPPHPKVQYQCSICGYIRSVVPRARGFNRCGACGTIFSAAATAMSEVQTPITNLEQTKIKLPE